MRDVSAKSNNQCNLFLTDEPVLPPRRRPGAAAFGLSVGSLQRRSTSPSGSQHRPNSSSLSLSLSHTISHTFMESGHSFPQNLTRREDPPQLSQLLLRVTATPTPSVNFAVETSTIILLFMLTKPDWTNNIFRTLLGNCRFSFHTISSAQRQLFVF